MKLTSQQHRNIADGMDRMRNHCLVAKDDAKYYYAQEEGTYFSARFNTQCSHIFEAVSLNNIENGYMVAQCKYCRFRP